jgi:nucleoside-diphosphate-sugar epimerase
MSITIAVTGAGGFVGNIVCRDLINKGYNVIGIDNFHKGNCDSLLQLVSNENFTFKECDVCDKNKLKSALEDADGVIHLAAIVGFPACIKHPVLATEVNVNGTKNVLSVRPNTIPIVNASTGSVYGKVEGICKEDSPLNTTTLYGITKRNAESLVSEAENTVSLRFATGFGVSPCMRVNLLINDLVYQAIANRCLTVFEADANRTFIHVRDMSKALILCLEKLLLRDFSGGLKHKVYNVGDNKMNITKRGLAEMIKSKTGCYVTYAEIGKDLDNRDYIVDYSKINDEGFTCSVSIEDGIDELIKATSLLKMRNPYE